MGAEVEKTLVRMQCGMCKTMLACEFKHRRRAMICPVCRRESPLVYIPPSVSVGGALHELPEAIAPGTGRRLWRSGLLPAAYFLLGFLACVFVYALDYGGGIDRRARKFIAAIRDIGEAPPDDAPAAAPTKPVPAGRSPLPALPGNREETF